MILEVIIAVALLGIGSLAIMNLQSNTLGRVRQAKLHLDNLLKLQNLFFDPQMQKNTQVDHAQMHVFAPQDIQGFKTFNYELVSVDKKSDLNRFADIYLRQAAGSWAGFSRDYEDMLVGLVYIPPKQDQDQSEQVDSEQTKIGT